MAAPRAVEDIGFQHGIKGHALDFDAIKRQHVHVVLDVLANFWSLRVFQHGLQLCKHPLPIELIRGCRVIMPNRDVCCPARFGTKTQTHQLSLHGVEAGGFCVEGEELCAFQLSDQGIELVSPGDCPIVCFH